MRRSATSILTLPMLFCLAACGDSGGGSASAGASTSASTGEGVTITSASASDGSTSLPTTGDAGTTTGGAPKFDLGGGSTTTNSADPGCTKVDFLFVIDNSASMEDNQAALVASFPGFIAAIKATLSATNDYHVMVVDSDDDGRCKQPCDQADPMVTKFCAEAEYEACVAPLDACDVTRGAGVIHPVGLFASNSVCPFAGDYRYMLPEEPDLEGTFACAARVGTAGNPSERPMNGMTEALSPALNGPGGCNEGFLRDDAILVVTFISDDPKFEDEGTPQAWYDAVVAAKQGNKDAIVVTGLIPQPLTGCVGAGVEGDINGAHWEEFIGLWGDRGIKGSVCQPDYSPFFAEAVGIIDATCDNFMPPS